MAPSQQIKTIEIEIIEHNLFYILPRIQSNEELLLTKK